MMLESLLNIETPTAIGHLQLFWWWALDYASDGNFKDIHNIVIAKAAQWKGNPDNFVEALTKSGFLNSDRTIHDWADYTGRLIAKREANKERMKEIRATHVQTTCNAQTDNVQNTFVPNSNSNSNHIHKDIPDITSNVLTVKDAYGEFENVFLTKEEYDKLLDKIGNNKTLDLIEQLSAYMKQNPKNDKKYKDHYATLLNWSRMDNRKDNTKSNNPDKYISGIYGKNVISDMKELGKTKTIEEMQKELGKELTE